jgi:hypothetical protein
MTPAGGQAALAQQALLQSSEQLHIKQQQTQLCAALAAHALVCGFVLLCRIAHARLA